MGDEVWKKRLNDPGYKNWLKVSLALIESKEALHNFTEKVIVAIHNDIKTRIGPGTCTGTSACNTRKGGVAGKEPSCPSCAQWVTEIKKYRSGLLHWKNADPTKWHNLPWEIAKCFMNPQGNKATAASVTGPDQTDLSGMLNVLVNCKEFGRNHLDDKKLPEHVRTVRNDLMHCATMSFGDAEMQNMVNKVIALLEDNKKLKHEKICQDKVEVIKSLRDNEFELKPKDEEVCIETALETHALAADSGEEIDENMMSKLSKLIKGNKDLERKFADKFNKIDKKITTMKQEYDAKFSMVDVIVGELKGRIELLEKNNASGQRLSSNLTSSVLGNLFYKSALQSYTQKKRLDLPKYDSNKTEEGMFVSTVFFDGKEFKSNEAKPSKKEAEQNAAEEALKFLGNEDLEVSNENNDSSSTEHQVMDSKLTSQQKDKNCKNLLQEKAQKKKIPNPIYNEKKTDAGFVSEVMYDGRWYSPDTSPQNRKVDAQQKAAQFVLACLNREESSELTSNGASPPRPDDVTDVDGKEINPTKNASKQFRAILNEQVQKITKGGKLPDYKAEKDSDGKFVCTVTVLGEVYKSPLGMNSMSDAKESAACEACKVLQLAEAVLGNSPRSPDVGSEKLEETPMLESTSDATDGATQRKSLTETTTGETSTSTTSPSSADRPDGKTYITLLQEYTQKIVAKPPKYEDIPGSDDDKVFRSKVIVLDKTFECAGSYSSKKASKQMAAKEAMKYFNGLPGENSSAAASAGYSDVVSPLDSNELSPNTTPAISAVTSVAKLSTGTVEPGSEQSSSVETVKPPSETSVSNNPDRQQTLTSTPKTHPNAKSALQEYVQKRKLGQGLRYESPQNPTTKEYLSKVFLGKRCFKGKEPNAKMKEAEKHVAEVALNTLEGRGGKLDRNCEELLSEYHKDLGFPAFPKYEEATCNDQGEFSVEVKVKKKYEYACNDRKPKKKDVEIWLAEQAVKDLAEENKMTPAQGNAKSRLNLFLQAQDGDSKLKYDVQGDQAGFTGCLCFYTVDVYESLSPQQSKAEAITSAAMSACNGVDLH